MKLRELVSEILQSEREIHGLERKTGRSLTDLKEAFKRMRQGERELKNAARRFEMRQEALLAIDHLPQCR